MSAPEGAGPPMYTSPHLVWLADDDANHTAIIDAGVLPPLVALLKTSTADAQDMAAYLLRILACKNAANKVAIAVAGAIKPLVALVTNGAAGGQERAAEALQNLAGNNAANKVAIAAAGGIAPLVALGSSAGVVGHRP